MRKIDRRLEQYINRLVKKHGTAGRVAAMIGMSLSAFSRGVKEEQTLSVENCLRLAAAVGDDAGMILRLAGKPHVADVVDLISRKTNETLSRRGLQIAQRWETSDPDQQDLIERLLATWNVQPSKRKGKRRPSAKKPSVRPRPSTPHSGPSSIEHRL